MSEILESDGIRVSLEWTLENESLYSYSVSINPLVAFMLTERTSLQLKVSYDTLYNVSIQSIPRCGQRNLTTSIKVHMQLVCIQCL